MDKRVLYFNLGIHLYDSQGQALAQVLTKMLSQKGVEFSFKYEDRCSTFETTKEVSCGIQRFAKMQSFVDGVRFAAIHSI